MGSRVMPQGEQTEKTVALRSCWDAIEGVVGVLSSIGGPGHAAEFVAQMVACADTRNCDSRLHCMERAQELVVRAMESAPSVA